MGGELQENVFVVLGAGPEVGAQDVVPHIEDNFRAELKASLDRPAVPEAFAERLRLEPGKLFEPGHYFLDPKQAPADRLRVKNHGGALRTSLVTSTCP
jgi:hypothetical protein